MLDTWWLIIVIVLLWGTPLVFPFKMLVVLFHEISHAMAAILTGGRAERIELNHRLSGCCTTRGGNRFFILNAGYLGSFVIGAGILLLVKYTDHEQYILGAMGGVLVGLALFLVRPMIGIGFLFVLLSAGLMVTGAVYFPVFYPETILTAIALVSCIYAPLDIFGDTIRRSSKTNDAAKLAELTGVPAVVWGVGWVLLSLSASAVIVWFVG